MFTSFDPTPIGVKFQSCYIRCLHSVVFVFTYQTIRNSDVCYLLFGHLNWRGHLKLGLQTLYRVLGLRTKLRYHQRPSIEPPQVLTSPTFHLELFHPPINTWVTQKPFLTISITTLTPQTMLDPYDIASPIPPLLPLFPLKQTKWECKDIIISKRQCRSKPFQRRLIPASTTFVKCNSNIIPAKPNPLQYFQVHLRKDLCSLLPTPLTLITMTVSDHLWSHTLLNVR